nr:MAG TPA: hypothetical protein [Bacteriophage sp.]
MLSLRHWRVLQAAAGSARSRAAEQAGFPGTARCITSLARVRTNVSSVPHDFFPVGRSKRGNLQVERVRFFWGRRAVAPGKVIVGNAEEVSDFSEYLNAGRTLALLQLCHGRAGDTKRITKRRNGKPCLLSQHQKTRSKFFSRKHCKPLDINAKLMYNVNKQAENTCRELMRRE